MRGWLRRARFYRLTPADTEHHAGFAAVGADGRYALVLAATLRSVPDAPVRRAYVPGLEASQQYHDVDRGTVWRGAALERFGLRYPTGRGDWVFDLYELEAV